MIPAAGAALIRLAAYPRNLVLPAAPDLVSGQPEELQTWLERVWRLPGFATAVSVAAPQLADQVTRTVSGEPLAPQRLRRVAESVLRYLLRWTTRATPFGTFAGIAPVQFGPRAAAHVGDDHHAVTRPHGESIAERTALAERDLARLRAAAVVTNPLGYPRSRTWVLPCAQATEDRRFDLTVRLTGPVQAAIQAARAPIPFAELTAAVAGAAELLQAERLVAGLVQAGVLVSSLRPPMTVTDPAAGGCTTVSDGGGRVSVDLRVDAAVTLPPAVLHEAARAATTLAALAPPWPGWVEYHHAFIDRWGPGAAVPIRDVLHILGYPAGYRSSARRVAATFTARDRLLAATAQRAALDGDIEVVVDDAFIDQLRGEDQRPPAPHTELRFTLAADTLHHLDRGDFTLTVTSGARHAGASAARFLHLLSPAELAAFRQVYQQLPTAMPGADLVQLSGPPLDPRMTTVARAPELLPVLPLGDFHPNPPWTVDDLAVTGDGQRLWLVSHTTGRPVEPLVFNSVLLAGLQQPMLRFLTEIWTAWTAPCSRFDWGHADSLPFLPRLRRGRTILSPARWTLDPAALPSRDTPWPQWRDAWYQQRQRHRLPRRVLIGDDDVQLRLDLDDQAHLAVLRSHLDRRARTVLTEAPGPAGWIGDRPAEILLTLTTPSRPAAPPPRPARAAYTVEHRPGPSPWLQANLYGHVEEILTDLAARPADHLPTGWWFQRAADPQTHIRLRIPIRDGEQFTAVTERLARWVDGLQQQRLAADYSLHPYRPETRHGAGATLAAAEAVFAADSHALLARLTGDRQAATAASMIAIADGFTGDGLRWLATHAPHHTGPRLNPAQLDRAREPFRDPRLAAALAAYRLHVDHDGLDPDQVLADLLHLHHARMVGVDLSSERHCLRLARAIARTITARQPR
ncbi:lantibiotic dehydratase [Dactylosporangium sp. NPDC051485]|uniref:lantibiotic dehydratase n=1 Tax=Dactylosporangium sp. NPDC051485 TaxID=3154846 RepID=UPI003424C7A8